MTTGFASAWNEITLVLFTTLAPSGVVAFILMAAPLVARADRMGDEARRTLEHWLWLPITVAMVGLVASATHLGNPANALYVLAGVGRSPLSNEVVCGVAFLGSAGMYWLTSFSASRGHVGLRRIALAAVSLAGALFVTTIAFAYHAQTIVSWHTAFVPLSLWLNALVGGPLLASIGLRMAGYQTARHRYGRALVSLAGAALAGNVVVYALWGARLPAFENAMTDAASLMPCFLPLTALFAALCACGVALAAREAWRDGSASPARLGAASLLALAGIFVMRFAFYMTHMTVGLGV
ncbi:MAG: dimethyl sulfoxide reductase anchor subunit [Eggerthellaceae bacterium]|nr:dimethyl sulfoxide reductase anchor subunit [Eggerthellaceae bacterium]